MADANAVLTTHGNLDRAKWQDELTYSLDETGYPLDVQPGDIQNHWPSINRGYGYPEGLPVHDYVTQAGQEPLQRRVYVDVEPHGAEPDWAVGVVRGCGDTGLIDEYYCVEYLRKIHARLLEREFARIIWDMLGEAVWVRYKYWDDEPETEWDPAYVLEAVCVPGPTPPTWVACGDSIFEIDWPVSPEFPCSTAALERDRADHPDYPHWMWVHLNWPCEGHDHMTGKLYERRLGRELAQVWDGRVFPNPHHASEATRQFDDWLAADGELPGNGC